ncbi:SpvB/TcaC N-terminal domain-containing protein [Sphaerothrix gracilis]|uniref:SpvB/TcaC N-terminal domain-containing protein n=1 Tax=Sphaerothrix gracilis TaxID=3151835 RepID=UPI0031FE1247
MSNKSGTSNQIISLPQGGGALHGIGETFSPNLHLGTGNFTVPIALPPGRNSLQPQLGLVYSTGNGNGPFGLGWGLSIPGVMRKTAKGLPRYRDRSDNPADRDTFVLSGAEDLVPVEQDSGLTRYQPRTEGLFARIEHHYGNRNNYWQVFSKDGLVSFYGTPRPENSLETWQDPAVIADPADPAKVYTWNLSRTVDPFGNSILYEYERDLAESETRSWNQLYLKQIQYADYGDPTNSNFLARVKFHYGDRPDPFSEYRAGFEIRTRWRCTYIQVLTQPNEEILTRTYHWVYLDQRTDLDNLDQLLPLNNLSLLSQVKVVGHDADATEALPPLEFGYSRFGAEGRNFFPLEGQDLPARSLGNPEIELADLFGNGLPDILEMNGTVRYWRNLGNGQFALPQEMKTAPAGLQLGDPGVQLIDADGDGCIDLMVHQEGLSGYFPLRYGGLWDRKSFKRYDIAPSFAFGDPDVQLMDLNGDGITDAIRSGSRLECFENHPEKGWHQHYIGQVANSKTFSFADPRIRWGDMSGDGLQDIVRIHDGNLEYWPNLGYGRWGRRIQMRNSPRFRYGYDPRRILIGDIDGDGADDLIYVDDKKVILWLNQSGNGWSDPIEIKGTPPMSDLDSVRLVDLLGTGLGGILWSADANGLSRNNLFFLDLTGGVKPYLLHQMDNHMGAVTRVRYAPSTKFYLEDQKRPETRWQTPLPMPVLVVDRVEIIDQISGGKLTTEYTYHHGYWDGAEREFRGFGRVEQLDTEVFEDYNAVGLHGESQDFEHLEEEKEKYFSPPLLTKSWFHQGPVGDEFGEWEELDYSHEYWDGDPQVLNRPPEMKAFIWGLDRRRVKRDALRTLRGRVLRTELYALDGTERQGRPYTVTEASYGVREESPPNVGDRTRQHIFLSFPLAQRTTQWERGEEPMTQFSFSEDYDEYGQPRKQIAIACARGWQHWDDTRDDYLATYAESSFAQRDDAQVYIVDRAAKASSYELKLTEQPMTVAELKQAALAGTVPRELIGQSLSYYDGPAFEGLPLGEIGNYGAPARSETLVLTEANLLAAHGEEQMPPYLVPDGAPAWTDEYPPSFREQMLPLAGYTFYPGDETHARGYWVTATRQQYDFQTDDLQPRGLLKVTRDPLGRDTQIEYDTYDLLPIRVTNPIGLTTEAEHDYRVMQPHRITDLNGNRSAITFTALGLPATTAVMGKAGEAEGDTLDVPGSWLEYDFFAFEENGQPIWVRTIQREHHVNEADAPPTEQDHTLEAIEYSDGFGRLLQTRTQSEDERLGDVYFGNGTLPADQTDEAGTKADVVGRRRTADDPVNVVVSGWQIYDNKGRVVEQYEPFYSEGWDYQQPGDEEMGQKMEMYYDPRGQVILTINPDGSRQRVIYGVPENMDNPNEFRPTPWEVYTYDANDLAPLSQQRQPDGSLILLADRAPANHHYTPASIEIDALGRTTKATERSGADPATDSYITRSTYDIRGNLLTVTDALGREAFRYFYDLANQPLRTENIDAGVQRTVLDAVGKPLEQRDSKRALILQSYDQMDRLSRLWARDGAEQSLTLRGQMEYGDGGTSDQPDADRAAARELNRLGQLVLQHDEAGRLSFEEFDFKGNLLSKTRRVIADAAILQAFENGAANNWEIQAFRVDWEQGDSLLEDQEHVTTMAYDALNRVKVMQYPADAEGTRQELRPQYNRAGALESVRLDGTTYVERIVYNAKGQRTLITYGNGVMTRYAYDPKTFRLKRMYIGDYNQPEELTYRPTGAPLQDFAYSYDLVGNITRIQDRAVGSGVKTEPLGDHALDRQFTYDPLYRLLSATGRECQDIPRPRPWADEPRCGAGFFNRQGTPVWDNAPELTTLYQETYAYDPAGNMTRLQHQQAVQRNGGTEWETTWSRNFGMDGYTPEAWAQIWPQQLNGQWLNPPGNKLTHVADRRAGVPSPPTVQQSHFFDINGNLIRENSARHFEWDHSDQLRVFRTQTAGAEPTVYAYYLYDATGQRVKKLVRKGANQYEVTVYIDGVFELHRQVQGSTTRENTTLHVMDDQSRIALVQVGESFPDDSTPAVKYHLGDHLGSSHLVVDASGNLVNREEFTPYGETSFGSFGRKRYRYTGKERDEESGLNYHGARYYAPWLVRWISCDPIGSTDGYNLYVSNRNNPIMLIDLKGTNSQKTEKVKIELSNTAKTIASLETELDNLQEAIRDLPDELEDLDKEINQIFNDINSLQSEHPSFEKKNKKFQKKLRNRVNKFKKIKTELEGAYDALPRVKENLSKAEKRILGLRQKGINLGLSDTEIQSAEAEGRSASVLEQEKKKKSNPSGGGSGGSNKLQIFDALEPLDWAFDANWILSSPTTEEGVRRTASVAGSYLGGAIGGAIGFFLGGGPAGAGAGFIGGSYIGEKLVYHADSVFEFLGGKIQGFTKAITGSIDVEMTIRRKMETLPSLPRWIDQIDPLPKKTIFETDRKNGNPIIFRF